MWSKKLQKGHFSFLLDCFAECSESYVRVQLQYYGMSAGLSSNCNLNFLGNRTFSLSKYDGVYWRMRKTVWPDLWLCLGSTNRSVLGVNGNQDVSP